MQINLLFGIIILGGLACQPANADPQGAEPISSTVATSPASLVDPAGTTIATRFLAPEGFRRTRLDSLSFGHYLRTLPLKPAGSRVKYFDGREKNSEGVYVGVVDMEIGTRDLQQCADAVMRLRGEYLFAQKRYQDIHFNFLSDGKPRYYRDRADANYSYKSFRKYMDYIFSYANTASLKKELKPVPFDSMQIGDVFIVQGNPYGHAIIVVDMAIHPETKERLFMLAQSYMPAQETQVLVNPNAPSISPWYKMDVESALYTPEWTFEKGDLHRFE